MIILITLLYFLIFILLTLVIFYLPGFWLISKVRNQLEDQEIISLSLAVATVLFVVMAILLGLLNGRFLALPILTIVSITGLIKFKSKIINPWKIFLRDKILLLLIILGILVQGFINFPSGFLYQEGLYFWSSQGHDGLWHVASMEEIRKSLPPQNPGFAGEPLYNYHYLVDVLMGEFLRIFPFFSALDLYFRFFPVLFSFMIGITVFALVTKWQGKRQVGYLALFFLYFTGSFGYVVNFIKSGSIFGGETAFWAAQQNTILGNPPHAMSHVLLPAFFLSSLYFFRERSRGWFLLSFLIGSILSGFKVSGGLVMLVGLGAAALTDWLKERKVEVVALAASLGISNLVTFKTMTAEGASSFLMFLPWWFIRTTIVDRLGWLDLELKRQHYLAQGTWHAYLRVIQIEAMAFGIFVVGNLGMRILGVIELVRRVVKKENRSVPLPFEVMLVVSMMTGLVMPIFFVQKGLIYNNIQFMQYFLLIFGFYAAISTDRILTFFKKRVIRIIIMVLIMALSLPTVIGNLTGLYGPGATPLSKITKGELEALKYLKDHSAWDAVILNPPFNPALKSGFPSQPKPIYAWYDTPYISALAGRRSYLASEHVTLLDYPDTKKRQENMEKFFQQSDPTWNRQFLKDEKINYIYLNKAEIKIPLDMQKNNLEKFFENNVVIIYKAVNYL